MSGWRDAALGRLRSETFDVVVIGGGIVGAGIARDAALRGLSVAVLERRDFAYGTSSRTSKLLHGGLRYLRQGRVRLVLQSVRERDRLHRQEPGLVLPIELAIPIYRGGGLGPLATRFGLWLYGLFARDPELGVRGWLPTDRVRAEEPTLLADGLLGAGTYHDCLVRDARLVLEVVKAAVRAGAVAASRVEVVGFEKEQGRLVAVLARGPSGDALTVRGRSFVNASGPWIDAVRALDDPAAKRVLRLTKGIHVLVPRERIRHEHAIVLQKRDRRLVFVLPWDAYSLVGTTDTDYHGSADEVAATAQDVAYLLEAVNAFFPEARLGPEDVVSTYAGLRPLVAEGHVEGKESDISRAHKVFKSRSGLVSIAGGKLTTYRAMAEDVMDHLARILEKQDRRVGPCRTDEEPLRRDPLSPDAFAAELSEMGLDEDIVRHLVGLYLSTEMLPLLGESPTLRDRLVPGLPYVAAQVVHAARAELACTLEDVLARRTTILLEAPRHGEECLSRVEEILAAELGWSEEERRRERDAYAVTVSRMLAFREGPDA